MARKALKIISLTCLLSIFIYVSNLIISIFVSFIILTNNYWPDSAYNESNRFAKNIEKILSFGKLIPINFLTNDEKTLILSNKREIVNLANIFASVLGFQENRKYILCIYDNSSLINSFSLQFKSGMAYNLNLSDKNLVQTSKCLLPPGNFPPKSSTNPFDGTLNLNSDFYTEFVCQPEKLKLNISSLCDDLRKLDSRILSSLLVDQYKIRNVNRALVVALITETDKEHFKLNLSDKRIMRIIKGSKLYPR